MGKWVLVITLFFSALAQSKENGHAYFPIIKHEYNLKILDTSSLPIKGVSATIVAMSDSVKLLDTTIVSDSNGAIRLSLRISSNPNYPKFHSYSSVIGFNVRKKGFENNSDMITRQISFTRDAGLPLDSVYSNSDTVFLHPIEQVKQIKGEDYFSEALLNDKSTLKFRNKINKIFELVGLDESNREIELQLKSVALKKFKNKNYLSFSFINEITYNSNKLSSYLIGAKQFEDVIIPALEPLNSFIGVQNIFYGYDILIRTSKKDFINDDFRTEKLEYRFLMPSALIKKYKDKEISGQKLIDGSIVLLNDDRIDLKLQ